MAKKYKTISRFVGGISDSPHEGLPDSYAFGRSIDVRTNPQQVTLLPRTIKESASVITALPKWGEYISSIDKTYIYDEAGNFYSRSSSGAYTNLHTVGSSHGNGMSWFGEDNFIYYTSDKLIGRYGPLSAAAPTFVDDFFGSQGGVPLNTNSLDLESGSTQYASRADTASLSITGNLAIEAWIKPESLPTSGNTMTLVSKWTENGNLRSYKLGIGTASNYFGDGSDGPLTISSNTTESPIDSACTGTSGTYSLSATNASFAAGQIIFIHQSQGTGAGNWQRNKIQSYTAGTITLVEPLNATYVTGAQVRVLKQYTNVTVNAGVTYTAKAWNGTVGGILAFLANGTVSVSGTLSARGGDNSTVSGGAGVTTSVAGATGGGFRGGTGYISDSGNGATTGGSGEGTTGVSVSQTAANGNGGGGGGTNVRGSSGGGGGGNGTGGAQGAGNDHPTNGFGGGVSGSADLTTMTFGGGGGGASYYSTISANVASGASGGGIVFVAGVTLSVSGAINANGGNGGLGSPDTGGGGSGAGGSVLLKCQTATLGTGLITASGGTPQTAGSTVPQSGGDGGNGRVHIDYLTSYTGTSTPTLTALQDANLGSSSGYTLFLSISSNGTNTETYTKPANLQTGIWQHVAVSWDQSVSTAELFLTGVSLGTQVGSLTSINDNASVFNIGRDLDGTSTTQNLYDGLIDEVRLFAGLRTEGEINASLYQHINAASSGLVGYWQFNGVATDAISNGNNLTLSGSPVYSTDVPFAAPTTRVDIDQVSATSGNTYALGTTISESSADKKSFTPEKDPQKSLRVYIAAKGTGNWTLTIHDQYNNVIASKTVANASLPTGNYEFIFDDVWRPLTNFTNSYHFHLTSTVADGTVRTTSSNDLSTVDFTTYYQFLVEDTSFHPIAKMLQFLVIGNERYVATYEATIFDPNAIALPAGYRVRCFGYWQEYLAIGVIKGDAITDQDQGRIYFWDGYSPFYNFYIPVPEGGINAFESYKGDLYFIAGYQGDLMVYKGGATAEKVKRLPKITDSKYIEIYPGAMTMWKGLMRIGVAGGGDTTDVQKGVYTYGHTNVRYPDILTYDYPTSTGVLTGTTTRIGLILPVNQKLLIGWQSGTGYGIDYVDASNDCYPTGTIEFLIDDSDAIWKEKLTNTIVAKTAALTSGQSIDLRYIKDDDAMWTYRGAESTVGETYTRIVLPDDRENEITYAVDLASTSGISPTLKGLGVEIDDLRKERRA